MAAPMADRPEAETCMAPGFGARPELLRLAHEPCAG